MGANIIAVKNETQILDGFGISNDNGYFSLNLKKDTEFNIKITFIGYKPIERQCSRKSCNPNKDTNKFKQTSGHTHKPTNI